MLGAVEASGGQVVKRVGDGFDIAFADAGAAVSAAQAIQTGLARVDWPETGPLRLRMAIDAGEVEARGGDYFGPVLNRAGRLLAAAHGGQVLVSGEAQAALSAHSGWQAKALGEFRFKGIGAPVAVFQLVVDGLPADFPPLRIDRPLPGAARTGFGRSVRGYELREQVGAGDFGVVYRAYQPRSAARWRSRSSAPSSSTRPPSSAASRPRHSSSRSSSTRTSSRSTTTGAIPTAPTW